ncbi:recombinase family protein [Brevundimonas nasdae]|uniref:Recombinase family protein n=1 Tax=Brevundimonas nasdae TaxID=172043 RepID=A0ABX8TJ09_9CAUL|nr:recombinase family protein [Brevundimonas nasdae]QYC15199.1 recombinase family protein [Brevundimonas nasdae]
MRDIDPAEAGAVREIFRRYVAGVSPRAIVSDQNARGVASARGGDWKASTIKVMRVVATASSITPSIVVNWCWQADPDQGLPHGQTQGPHD